MSTQDLVAKLWNLCNLLRDDGVTYHEYINELTFLVFLKMVEETGQDELIPSGCRWSDLEAMNSATRLEAYKKMLVDLGSHGSQITQAIYNNANTVIRKPATLNKLVTEIDKLDWYSAKTEGLGDMYEGLLEINATEKKSGAGQYFHATGVDQHHGRIDETDAGRRHRRSHRRHRRLLDQRPPLHQAASRHQRS
ncbi:type I restriction-modification system subunit M N-terminal domain-containing protein [Methylomonas sp. LWB]|uniref:type I restriction-modification system subunit M N-terminal domain-containing protein n=1 Tax=Methylomonas sp. LWB TaxID=1905845 RepID=UPI000B256643|nr:type I restriction-modification system subunit M N-terminal domain-containing protein [Methylomonas sp. LWB]